MYIPNDGTQNYPFCRLKFPYRDLKGIRQWQINICTSPMIIHTINPFCSLKLVVGHLTWWTNQSKFTKVGTSVINSSMPKSLCEFLSVGFRDVQAFSIFWGVKWGDSKVWVSLKKSKETKTITFMNNLLGKGFL